MRATEAHNFANVDGDASPLGPFAIYGGRYQLATTASGYGTDGVQLEQLGPDGSTWLAITDGKSTANGAANVDLPPGQFRFTLDASVAGLNLTFVRVPVSE